VAEIAETHGYFAALDQLTEFLRVVDSEDLAAEALHER
jgi:hypothetical protein